MEQGRVSIREEKRHNFRQQPGSTMMRSEMAHAEAWLPRHRGTRRWVAGTGTGTGRPCASYPHHAGSQTLREHSPAANATSHATHNAPGQTWFKHKPSVSTDSYHIKRLFSQMSFSLRKKKV